MIRIINVTKGKNTPTRVGVSSKFGRTTNSPLLIALSPGEFIDIPKITFSQMPAAVKEHIAEYAANGILEVYEADSVHKYKDKGNKSKYDADYIINVGETTLILEHLLNMASDLHDLINAHYDSLLFHNTATTLISSAKPTDLTTLITWLTDAQTTYSSHIASGAAHPFVDATNILTLAAPTDLATSIAVMKELYRAYHSHLGWVNSTYPLDIIGILSY